MSSKLWEYFIRDDVDNFQQLLASASYPAGSQRASVTPTSPGSVIPPSPNPHTKGRKVSGTSPGSTVASRSHAPRSGISLSRIELNARDQYGRTLLHHVASSQKPTAFEFAIALLDTPYVDIYAQDWESGWTALHRALYAGNATIAQALMTRELREATEFNKFGNAAHPGGTLIKVKDREGYSPFDVYGATITSRDIKQIVDTTAVPDLSDPDRIDSDSASGTSPSVDDDEDKFNVRGPLKPRTNFGGDEVFTFGSNKNLSLGLGDQDDRQFPEQVTLTRPTRLIQRFFREYEAQQLDRHGSYRCQPHDNSEEVPSLIKNRPIKFQDVAMSKLHTAILTNDPMSNLFLCGYGPGGRLGTGDESTRFNFTCIETGGLASKKIISVALGQDHTLAITERGEIFSWGSNKFGQLGYSLPKSSARDDAPVQTTPRQIFNPFKKETVFGAAASAIHSVVFTSSGLYTFGKNEGQLGLVDSDAGSLEVQTIPRRVGASLFSCPIQMVTAIDHATAVLLQNNEVWVFSQYGYPRLSFPLDIIPWFIKNSFMATRYDTSNNRIVKITSGGQTICALSSFGEVFTVHVNRPGNPPRLSSTTNPVKIRNSLSTPVRVWSPKKSHMAVKDVDVGQDGSIIICTVSGSAWRKEERNKPKGKTPKDYKFARIPGLSRTVAVRSNSFGAFAAVQRECDVTKEQIHIGQSTLWNDILPLSPFEALRARLDMPSLDDVVEDHHIGLGSAMSLKATVLVAADLEPRFVMRSNMPSGTVWITSTLSDAQIPVHEFLLAGRSPVLRKALFDFRRDYYFSMPDVLAIEYGQDGQCNIRLQGVDFLTILNLAFFLYTDDVLDVWHQSRSSPESAFRYRQVRTEVMRIATHLGLFTLERAARLMTEPTKSLKTDMRSAMEEPLFFEGADVVVQLNGDYVKAHSQVLCQRCPFFYALFHGLSGGRWVSSRRTDPSEVVYVDLKHIDRTIFDFVLQYIYADTEEQLFDEVRSKDLDDFIDLVIDVAFVANELMIDRLAQICQKVLGRFVNTRNVCHLLNSVSPCAVTEFKDASLEYVCLNLEDMLANRLLQGLDEDLLRELDAVCRENQLACYPVSRGRNSDDYVFERYPEIVAFVESDKQERADSMKLRLRLNRAESYEARPRPMPNQRMPVSTPQKPKTGGANEGASSPMLKSKQSTGDLMFPMDDVPLTPAGPIKRKAVVRGVEGRDAATNRSDHGFSALGSNLAIRDRSSPDDRVASQDTPLEASSPESRTEISYKRNDPLSPPDLPSHPVWGSPVPSNSKGDLKAIMAEASQVRQPSYAATPYNRETSGNFTSKPSQKERKKLQQQQTQEKLAAEETSNDAPKNPWNMPAKKTTEKETDGTSNGLPEPIRPAQKPAMTLRQTIAGTPPTKQKTGAATPESQDLGVSANTQTPVRHSTRGSSTAAPSKSPNIAASAQRTVQSIRHIPHPEPQPTSFHSPSSQSQSLASIFMQQQTEKNEIREAATAKHNLEDIQLEQEFQEWWDKESKRVQEQAEAEAETAAGHPAKDGRGGGRNGRGKGQRQPPSQKRRGGGGGGGGGRNGPISNVSDVSALTQQLSGHDPNKNHNNNDRPDQPKQRAPSGGNRADAATHTAHHPRRGNNPPGGKGKKDRDKKPIVT